MKLYIRIGLALGLFIAATVLWLAGNTRARQLQAEISKAQSALRQTRAEARKSSLNELEVARDARRKEVEAFKERCLPEDEIPRLKDALHSVGTSTTLTRTDLGEYVRTTYRLERGGGPVSDWALLAERIVNLNRTPGVVLRSFRVQATGDAQERRLSSFDAELAVYSKTSLALASK